MSILNDKYISPLSFVNELHGTNAKAVVWAVTTDDDTHVIHFQESDGSLVPVNQSKDELVSVLSSAKIVVVRNYTGKLRDGVNEVELRGYNVSGSVSAGDWHAEKIAAFDLELSCKTNFETGERLPPILGEVFC